MTPEELAKIRDLVGDVSAEQLRYVDCFVGNGIGLFIPAVGPCFYAITPDHSHPAYSFVLTFDTYTQVVVGSEVLSSLPGEVMAIDPGVGHHELAGDEPPRYIAVLVNRALFDGEVAHYPSVRPQPFRFRTFTPGREFISHLKEFMNEAEACLPARDALLDAIGIRIIHAIIRTAYGISAPPDRIGNRVEIHRAIEYIQTHAGDKLNVDKLAAVAAMSSSHFSRVFRQETGFTPLAYLTRVRLDQAKKLLRAGERSISTVALACGFASPSHFTDIFRRASGQTPSDFLKALR